MRDAIRQITGKDYEIPNFAQHLSEFADAKRGKILTKTGDKRRYRYRFSDPLMQPFVIMKGIAANRVPDSFLEGTPGQQPRADASVVTSVAEGA